MTRKLITLWRIIRTGLINFLRNASLAVAAMAVMIITLAIVLFSIITSATFNNTINQLTNRIDVSVYLKDSTDQTKAGQLVKSLERLPNVQQVTYLTKDQVLERYKLQNAGNAALLEAISQTDNPLPATVQIKPKDLGKIQDIRDYLNTDQVKSLWEDVSYRDDRKAAIDKIARATDIMRKAGIATVVIFAAVSMVIIFNTIRMAIFNRRDELTIMRLLGASTWFIRGPFVVETVAYGVVSALVSVLLIHMLFVASNSALQATSLGLLDIGYSAKYMQSHFWQLLGIQLVLGILIGAASSMLATRRYLKFKTAK